MSSPDREKEREMIRRIEQFHKRNKGKFVETESVEVIGRIVPLLFYVSFEKLERLERLLRLEIKDKN